MVVLKYLRIMAPGLICYLLLFWLSGSPGLILLPVLVALLIYILGHDEAAGIAEQRPSSKLKVATTLALMGIAIGFLGGLVAVLFLTRENYVAYVNQIFPHAKDQTLRSFTVIYPELVLTNHVNEIPPALFIFISTTLTGLFSFFIGLIKKDYARYVSWVLLTLICLGFTFAVSQGSGEFQKDISEEPPNLSYKYDGAVYLKTFYLMAEKDFYTGYVEAAANHQGVANANMVRNGKFYGYVHSPLYFRTPTVFYFLRLVTFGNAVGVLYLGIVFALALIVLSYLTAKRLVGESGIFLPIVLVPYLVAGSIWHNVFFPDWWAAIMLTAGILFWLREEYWLSAASFLIASGFREIVFGALIVFLIFTIVSKKEARLQFALAAGLFVAVYPWHFLRAREFIGVTGREVSSITSRLSPANFFYSSSYMTYIYNFFFGPIFLMMLIALVVWFWKRRFDMVALTVLAFPYFAYASSSYWGQHLLLFIIFSAFMVFFLKRDEFGAENNSKS